jgi:rubrerythrin
MKIIKCLSDFIEEEIDAAKHYIEKALKYKDSNPDVAEIFYSLSNEEMRHVNILHDEVTKVI